MRKDLKKLSDLYIKLLQIQAEMTEFETEHPRIEAVKAQMKFIIKQVDEARHSLRDLWQRIQKDNF